jgi:hypothetical protein
MPWDSARPYHCKRPPDIAVYNRAFGAEDGNFHAPEHQSTHKLADVEGQLEGRDVVGVELEVLPHVGDCFAPARPCPSVCGCRGRVGEPQGCGWVGWQRSRAQKRRGRSLSGVQDGDRANMRDRGKPDNRASIAWQGQNGSREWQKKRFARSNELEERVKWLSQPYTMTGENYVKPWNGTEGTRGSSRNSGLPRQGAGAAAPGDGWASPGRCLGRCLGDRQGLHHRDSKPSHRSDDAGTWDSCATADGPTNQSVGVWQRLRVGRVQRPSRSRRALLSPHPTLRSQVSR